MIKLCIANRKGGVSKTTTAVNLSSILAELGKSVLLIDLDPQSNATDNLGISSDILEFSAYDIIAKDKDIREVIIKTEFDVDLIPSSSNLADAELEVASKMNRERIISDAITSSGIDYDFIIFDLPPNLGLLSINGLVASDEVIIPVDIGKFSLSGIGDLLEIISLIRKSQLNPNLNVLGVLMTKVDYRTNISKEMERVLKESVGDKVFKAKIRQNVKIAECQSEQKPINHFDKNCSGYREYLQFAKEVLEYV